MCVSYSGRSKQNLGRGREEATYTCIDINSNCILFTLYLFHERRDMSPSRLGKKVRKSKKKEEEI